MQKKRFYQNLTIIVLGILIIGISVGYATFATPISFASTPNYENKTWDVHFANIQKLNTTNIIEENLVGPTLINNATSLSFAADLKVGDTYEFTVDVVNAGSFNAELTNYNFFGTNGSTTILNSSTSKPLNDGNIRYTVDYVDNTSLTVNDTLMKGSIRTLKVTVKYIQSVNEEDPTAIENFVFQLNLNYAQTK